MPRTEVRPGVGLTIFVDQHEVVADIRISRIAAIQLQGGPPARRREVESNDHPERRVEHPTVLMRPHHRHPSGWLDRTRRKARLHRPDLPVGAEVHPENGLLFLLPGARGENDADQIPSNVTGLGGHDVE